MTLLGGVGTVFGPVVGAFLVVTIQTYLAQIGSWVTIIQGVIFVVLVLAFRRGIVGELGRSEEHTSELQSLLRISYAVFCLTKKTPQPTLSRTIDAVTAIINYT